MFLGQFRLRLRTDYEEISVLTHWCLIVIEHELISSSIS